MKDLIVSTRNPDYPTPAGVADTLEGAAGDGEPAFDGDEEGAEPAAVEGDPDAKGVPDAAGFPEADGNGVVATAADGDVLAVGDGEPFMVPAGDADGLGDGMP